MATDERKKQEERPVLLEVRDLHKLYHQRVPKRTVGYVRAVDGVSFR